MANTAIVPTEKDTDITPKEGFVPSSRQADYLMRALMLSKTKTTQEVEDWFKDEDFTSWYHRGIVRYMQNDLLEIYQSLSKQAKKGLVPAIKLYFERFDLEHQAFLGKIDLATHSTAAPVSSEAIVKALVKEMKINPEFKGAFEHEMLLEGQTITVGEDNAKEEV